MSAAAAKRLRLAHSATPVPVAVATGQDDLPASGDALLLADPLGSALAAAARMHAIRGRMVVQLTLPGIATRYLTGVARAAALAGWGVPELAALVVELERRCAYVLVARNVGALDVRPSRRWAAWRPQAIRFQRSGWAPARASRRLVEAEARSARARGSRLAVRLSGTRSPRWTVATLSDLTALGAQAGTAARGVAPALGSPWALELLAAPPLGSHQLDSLRDRFASAPRCDWCGLPVIGRHCRRCTPGDGS
jgi:hypothetical protein